MESQYCPSRRLADYIRKVDVADPAAVASGGSSSGSGTTTAKIAGWETAPRTAMALMKVRRPRPWVSRGWVLLSPLGHRHRVNPP
mgnify:CR=1 FL=1